MINFEQAFAHLLRWEGGYVNDPDDLGGETKYGITKRRYPRLDIKRLTVADARRIYKKDFFDDLKLGLLPDQLQYLMFDGCVNQGPDWTIKALQRRADVEQDGKIGPLTARATKSVHAITMLAIREERYRYIAGFRQNAKFLRGWLNRLDDCAEVTYAGFPNVTRSAAAPTRSSLNADGVEVVGEVDDRVPSCWRPGTIL